MKKLKLSVKTGQVQAEGFGFEVGAVFEVF
jgi:hypothetical protein